jgi:formylmethanofuran:tetrahydromethanopterin formyltransferase
VQARAVSAPAIATCARERIMSRASTRAPSVGRYVAPCEAEGGAMVITTPRNAPAQARGMIEQLASLNHETL